MIEGQRGAGFVNMLFGMVGETYRKGLQNLDREMPDHIVKVMGLVIIEARKRSGLQPERSLRLLKYLREALDNVIKSEGG